MGKVKHKVEITPGGIKNKLKEAFNSLGSLKTPRNLPELQPLEIKVFVFLLSNPCCLFDKVEVENAIWSERKRRVDRHTLHVMIHRINLKIVHTGWGIILWPRGKGLGWFPQPECVFFEDR